MPDALSLLEAAVGCLVDARDLDGALTLIQHAGRPIWSNTQAQGCISRSALLDQFCQRIGEEVRGAATRTRAFSERPHGRHVYAVSELYRDGGHTRVLEDMIRAHPNVDHHLIWSVGESVPPIGNMAQVLRVKSTVPVHALLGEPTARLRQAFRLLDALDPDVLVHLGHPDDPTTLALMQVASAPRQLLIHIADCSFALGRTLEGVIHVALGRHFQRVASSAWGLKTAFLPLTCEEPIHFARRAERCAFVTATSGSSHKFDTSGGRSYLDILTARFTERDGTHVHFGPLTHPQMQRIVDHLVRLSSRDRFIHVPHVPHLATALSDAGVALYFDSYPVGGARANIEAMAAAMPICASSHDPNLDGVSFCYPECLTWTDPAELRPLLAGLHDETLRHHSRLSRGYFERNHSFAVFKQSLDALISGEGHRAH